jgi:hypothetical protein
VANNDVYFDPQNRPLVVPAPGVLANDTDPNGLALTASVVTPVNHGTLTLNADGSFTFVPAPNFAGTATFTYVANNGQANSNVATVTIFVSGSQTGVLAVGTDVGGGPEVKVYDPITGALRNDFFAFDPSFLGGVRVATGDVNGDGIPDIVAAAGPTGGPQVNVFDGATGFLIRSFFAYDPSFTGGVNVAVGDVNGDGQADIITGAGPGGGPHVKVFDGRTGAVIQSFFAYDATFTGGVSVAAGDVNLDGFADIVTGAGPGGGPHVKVFDGKTGALTRSFFAFPGTFTGGVNVAAGDVTGDGFADVIAGAGPGGGPGVNVYDGRGGALVFSFNAFDPGVILPSVIVSDKRYESGVRVGVTSVVSGRESIVVGTGPGRSSQVKVINPVSFLPSEVIDPFNPLYIGGVYVGGS